jgi:hypothetical protein
MRTNYSTVIPAEIATAATWVSSAARSPTTWQPMVWWLLRSTMRLQKPVVRPSMMGREAIAKGVTTAVASVMDPACVIVVAECRQSLRRGLGWV